jgi:hypothetical protein
MDDFDAWLFSVGGDPGGSWLTASDATTSFAALEAGGSMSTVMPEADSGSWLSSIDWGSLGTVVQRVGELATNVVRTVGNVQAAADPQPQPGVIQLGSMQLGILPLLLVGLGAYFLLSSPRRR